MCLLCVSRGEGEGPRAASSQLNSGSDFLFFLDDWRQRLPTMRVHLTVPSGGVKGFRVYV